jgi:predicted peptidase
MTFARLTTRQFLVATIWAAWVVAAAGQQPEKGFLDRSVRVNGMEYRYQVYVPRGFDAQQKWPVVLALHGGQSVGDDGVSHTAGGISAAIRRHAERFPAVVVLPQSHADGTPVWQGPGGRAALAALDRAMDEFHGDASRIYLTGYSAGGNGAWQFVYQSPERFAAVVVVCGFVSELKGRLSGVDYPALAPGERNPFEAIAKRALGLPIWIWHGDADTVVSVDESRRMMSALTAVGGKARYTELPGVGHPAWETAYEDPQLWAWLFQQRR